MIEPNPTMGGAPVRVDGPMSGIMTGASGTLTVLSGDPHVQTWFWSQAYRARFAGEQAAEEA